jgi:hypothetical protein
MTITRRRPGIPRSYGISEDEQGMLGWDAVTGALVAAPVYWVSTVRPDGLPHLIPIWGAWAEDAVFIEGGDETRWARNLTEGDGRVDVGVDSDGMQVMVRGVAAKVEVADDTQTAIADGYEAKYPYRPDKNHFWRIAPTSVLAWRVDPMEAFASTPTQFDFESPS